MTLKTLSLEKLDVPCWLVLLEGIAAIILDLLLLAAPGATRLVLVQYPTMC